MTEMVSYAVGQPWPYPLAAPMGMQILAAAGEEGLSVDLVAAVPRPTVAELDALRAGPIRLAIYPSPPLVWIALDAGRISFDAPYALGIVADAADILASAARAEDWGPTTRGMLTIPVVDSATGIVASRVRVVSLSRDWWQTLARALAASPARISADEHQAAMARDLSRLSTADMIAAAAIVEQAGT